ncbi:PAS domain-containing sensor histidine kinase [Bacillus sp. AFS076308]|uniref:ATP-binding protein n=1 Tax=unclassified Bacillus (in: firmicutes) TaxID=185979 RepID=UPI000BF83D5E|nr:MULTISPECIES: ATP-binding protein [unclassified Bacillus (in: firmicutes)]PFN77613.1 PAS domain-containing sensor histidine kinase [Bacillus sp. AFS076308]PGV45306.1 PAS domain-containing sensor histidine kinase [Bacillus sp. AFS037270]
MKRKGQLILVSISIVFTIFQKLTDQHDLLTLDFFIFTIIAWFVGWQYDKARYYEKKARASEESYKKLIDSLPQPVYITQNHRFLYANNAAVNMAGFARREDMIGKYLFDFILPEYKDRLMERFKQINKEKSPVTTIEYKAKRLDGSTFFFEVTSLFISYGGEKAILSMGKDITDRKEQTESLLQKSEKLALLGQMAAGIAHEIRNPLTSIRGFIQLFKSHHLKDEYFDIVLSELDRINAIVSEFLVLAKPTAAVYKECDITELLNDVVTLIGTQSILNNVEIAVEYETGLPMVSCEVNQLKQVFLNLFKNAIEAMPNGGNIVVNVKRKSAGQIAIQIIDEGVGIPKERLSTLGEPFYTTKEKGTGLGLMTCYKIIESHHGILDIQSKVNKGTTIEIILPSISQTLLKIESIKI